MNEDIAIKVENVSKKYCKSLKRSMLYGISDIGSNLLGLSAHSERLRKGEFWAVNDVSFELKRGETLGIIGPNGSGKTTLLKMLNGIFWPDKGKITVNGRVSALIEVGAGFHPLLTGRENIYINGAILGMTKKEIDAKFDQIVEFADIGDFLDSPVKHYSSGMYVRLGFAVAVHCEPDILLVDEVLAVGDSVFRTKCVQKMNEIKKTKNVSIIYISHDLLSVGKFCDRAIFIKKGDIISQGNTYDVIRDYQTIIAKELDRQKCNNEVTQGMPYCTKAVKITNIEYLDKDNQSKTSFIPKEPLGFRVEYQAEDKIPNPIFQISVLNQEGYHIAVFGTHIDQFAIKELQGKGVLECWIDNVPLLFNKYYLSVAIYDETHNITHDYWNGAVRNCYFTIAPNKISQMFAEYTPLCQFDCHWKISE